MPVQRVSENHCGFTFYILRHVCYICIVSESKCSKIYYQRGQLTVNSTFTLFCNPTESKTRKVRLTYNANSTLCQADSSANNILLQIYDNKQSKISWNTFWNKMWFSMIQQLLVFSTRLTETAAHYTFRPDSLLDTHCMKESSLIFKSYVKPWLRLARLQHNHIILISPVFPLPLY